MTAVVLTLLIAYLIGAIPFGVLVARWRGVDILHQGSGNIGATNVGRVLGRRFGTLVFLLDFAKGALPVAVAGWVPITGLELPPQTLPVCAGIAAFLGHLFPIYLRFHGGKGVATGAGIVAVLVPLATLGALLTWLVLVAAARYVSLASLAAAVVLCGLRLALTPQPWGWDHGVVTGFCLVAVGLVFVRHHANLRRLVQGTENRLKDSPAMLQLSKILHVLALGLWFGTAVFFTLLGLVIFQTFEDISLRDPRPLWFPLPASMNQEPPSPKFPNPLRKEQGARAAGEAVGPLFPWYYGIQAGCGLVAGITAFSWYMARKGQWRERFRTWVIALALLTVIAGWWLEHVVHDLRGPRNAVTDAVLSNPSPRADEIQHAEETRAAFGRWHGYSLLVNFVTLALATMALVLAAQLPAPRETSTGEDPEKKIPVAT